jgi:hypothetical protein
MRVLSFQGSNYLVHRDLIDSLPQQLEQGMIRMAGRSEIIDLGRRTVENVESLVNLSHQKKAGIGGDLCALEVNADGAVKFRPYGPYLLVTNCAHKAFPPPYESAT